VYRKATAGRASLAIVNRKRRRSGSPIPSFLVYPENRTNGEIKVVGHKIKKYRYHHHIS